VNEATEGDAQGVALTKQLFLLFGCFTITITTTTTTTTTAAKQSTTTINNQ